MSENRLLNEKQAASYLGLSVSTLQAWRWRGRGPAYLKLGGRTIRYRMADLDSFLAGCRVESGKAA